MTKQIVKTDITVRGGLINVPDSTKPLQSPRHQPNTPPNKKATSLNPAHKPYVPEPEAIPTDPPTVEEPEPTDEIPEELE